jgi:hypothetical protein
LTQEATEIYNSKDVNYHPSPVAVSFTKVTSKEDTTDTKQEYELERLTHPFE